jgi:hypothetical protein
MNQCKNWSWSTNFVAVGGATAIARPLYGTKQALHAHQTPDEASETLKLAPVLIALKSWGDRNTF